MAVFELQGPDGAVYEVDAPDEASAVAGFHKMQGGSVAQDAPAPAQEKPPLDDILDPKSPSYSRRHGGSFVTGLVDAVTDAVTLPRDVYEGKVDLNTDEGADRVGNAALVVNPAVPQGLARIAPNVAKPAVAAPAKEVGQVARAANRQGIEVPIAAATDSVAIQRAAQVAKNVPGAGNPLVKATERTIDQLGTKTDDLAGSLGGAGMEQAGETASKGVAGWIKGKSGVLTEKAYKAVDDLVDPAVKTELKATRGTVAEIAAKRDAAALPPGSAVNTVLEAVQRPGGLTYEGTKTLRSQIGEMMDNGLLPSDMSKTDLKRLYSSLSDDLKSAVESAGGPKALSAFNRANSLNRVVSQRRESLAKLVGKGGDRTPAQVYDRLLAAAGSKSRADTALLLQARKAIGGDDWKEMSSAIVGRLGRDADGNFSPDRFVSDYGKLSTSGRSILFSGEASVKQALDDIATISARMRDVHKKFGNPSGTAQGVMGGAAFTGLWADPVTTVSALVGANVFSRIVSRPAVAKAMRDYARTAEQYARIQSPAAKAAIERAKIKMLEVAEKAAAMAANDNSSRAAVSGGN